mmetsp:Transcript_6831/g.14806  ORF Transcript_6831/g.14806 Transcript_6831/m.14806 type:complete len:281 (+) Transcript_6831:1039-1881(+)
MMPRVGNDHLRIELLPHPLRDAEQPLLRRDGNARHHQRRPRRDLDQFGRGGDAGGALEGDGSDEFDVGGDSDGEAGGEKGEGEEEGADALEFAVAVGVVVVRGEAGHLDGPEGDEVGEEVAEGVAGVGDEGGGVACDAHCRLAGAEQDVDDDSEEGDSVGGVVVSEEIVGAEGGAVFQHGDSPALALFNDRLGFVADVVGNGQDAREGHEGPEVGSGHEAQGAVFQDGRQQGDEAGEEDADGTAARQEDEFALPAFGEGLCLLGGMAVVVVVGVAVAHVH